jgi:predicted metal-dependent hydrolase
VEKANLYRWSAPQFTQAIDIFAFDMLIRNPDRRIGKPNMFQNLEESVPEEIFKAEVRSWASSIGVEPHTITLRPMKRKWASCSSKGNLTFDTVASTC